MPLATGKPVRAKVNDQGPDSCRTLGLSPTAAQRWGMTGKGTALSNRDPNRSPPGRFGRGDHRLALAGYKVTWRCFKDNTGFRRAGSGSAATGVGAARPASAGSATAGTGAMSTGLTAAGTAAGASACGGASSAGALGLRSNTCRPGWARVGQGKALVGARPHRT
jgi:hypothetical protein